MVATTTQSKKAKGRKLQQKIQKDIKNEKDIMKQISLIDKITELIKDREEL